MHSKRATKRTNCNSETLSWPNSTEQGCQSNEEGAERGGGGGAKTAVQKQGSGELSLGTNPRNSNNNSNHYGSDTD